MGLLYPWATREYILWKMTWAQVIMYMNEGIRQKFPEPGGNNNGNKPIKKASDMTYDEVKRKREELRLQYGEIGN